MSDLARLLQQYGSGEQPNALAQDGVTYDTSNVLAAMPKPNPLADALRIAMRSLPENKEHAFSMSNMLRGGLDTAASWLDYQNKPQPSDYKPSEMLAPLGAGLMGTAFAPQNALGIFGGRLAKTADHAALAKAEELAAKGADRKEIWDQTGWFQGADGKWRFEIDDSEAVKRWFGRSNLGGTIKHDDLFDAYPDLAGVKTRKLGADEGVRGLHDPGRGWSFDFSLYSGKPPIEFPRAESIAYKNNESALSTLLHETQHAVQKREGFSGGRPSWETDYGSAPGEIEARMVQARQALTDDERRRLPPWETRIKNR